MLITQSQVQKLLKGNYTFSMWSFSILVTRLKQLYASNNQSDDILNDCVLEIDAFVRKFQKIMGRDYALIESLAP